MHERLGAAPVNPKPFHFVTWNDEGTGEYCLWTIIANRKEKETIQFEWYPRLLYPKIRDSAWLEVRNHPLFVLAPLTVAITLVRTGSPCFGAPSGLAHAQELYSGYPVFDQGRRQAADSLTKGELRQALSQRHRHSDGQVVFQAAHGRGTSRQAHEEDLLVPGMTSTSTSQSRALFS
jgi:hypothetical protein